MNKSASPPVYKEDVDTQLVLLAQAGNKEAFDELVRRYGKRVYHSAYSFLRNVDDASDIVQEVFLRAYRSLGTFDPRRALFPWLYRITRNLCINRVRKSSNREATIPDENMLKADSEDPLSLVVREEQQRDLAAAVERLPEKHRQIIVLKHFQDCSYAEMAEILDVPIGTVMSRLYNARTKLRDMLSEGEA